MNSEVLGETLGPYTIRRVLGHGGMGVVYEAYEAMLDRRVALKLIRNDIAQQKDFLTRFQREAKLAARVNHPNLVTVYAADFEKGCPYLAMEFVEGETLAQVIQRRGRLPVQEALRLAREVANGLSVIHHTGIIHRDIKPANIMIEPSGGVRLMDFGLAKPLNEDMQITQGPAQAGTPRYMAPEQYRGEEVSRATDVYALGVTLYQMLAGESPFQAPNQAALMRQILDEGPTPISDLRPELPPKIVQLVSKMMARSVQERYAKSSDLIAALDACLGQAFDLDSTQPLMQDTVLTKQVQHKRWPPSRREVVGANAFLAIAISAALFLPHGVADTKYLLMKQQERNAQIVLIDVGEWPPKDEAVMGKLLRTLAEKGAPVIGVDIILDADSSLRAPQLLAEPIRQAGKVVLASDLRGGKLLSDLTQGALKTGFANVPTDWDGTVRRANLIQADATGQAVKSFALSLVEAFHNTKQPLSRDANSDSSPQAAKEQLSFPDELLIDFGAIRQSQVIPLSQFFEIARTWESQFCQDKVFVIGTTASADKHDIPLWGKCRRIAGLTLQGCIVDNLLRRQWCLQAPLWAEGLTLLLLASLGFAGGKTLGPRWLAPIWLSLTALIALAAALMLRIYAIVCPMTWPIIAAMAASSLAARRRKT